MKTEWEFIFNPDPAKVYPGADIVDGQRCGKPMLDPTTGTQLLDSEDSGKPRFWPGREPAPLSKFTNQPMARRAASVGFESSVGLPHSDVGEASHTAAAIQDDCCQDDRQEYCLY